MGTDPQSGTRLGGYVLGDLIGRGGMGVVYRATHVHLGREVALKVLAPELSQHEDFRERFLRESRLAASLDHPNVVTVYDAGDADGTLYIAMRYVEGTDLAQFLRKEGPVAPSTAIAMLAQVGAALDAAHSLGLIHRDVKPGNVLISSGRCYLTDFGLTKQASASAVSAGLTRTGQFLGTVDYVAPEQIEGREIDGRADVYALACMLHECLTGARPFPKDSELAVIFAHLSDPPPRPTELRPELPAAIDEVIATGMAKSPDKRYSTCAELIAAASAALGVDSTGAPTAGTAATRGGTATRVRARPSQLALDPTVAASTIGDGTAAGGASGGGASGGGAAKAGATAGGATARAADRGGRRSRRILLFVVGVLAVAAIAGAVIALAGGGGNSKQASTASHSATTLQSQTAATGAHVVGTPIRVGKTPLGIAGNASVLWVANSGASTVSRVTLNGKVRTDIALAAGPFGVFNTGDTFWVSSSNAGVVTPISVSTGLPGKPITVGRWPEFLTGDENSIFVSNAHAGSVSVINARTFTVIGAPITVGKYPRGIAFSGTAVWVANSGSDNVARIVNGQVIKTIPVGHSPTGVAVGDNAVWVANSSDNTVSRINLADDTVKTIVVGKDPFAIAFGFGYAWVTNRGDDTVTQLDASTGEPVGSPIPVGRDPAGIAVIGESVWVTNGGSDDVVQIKP